jgi:D-glycero-alpha-D-manno-heptose-7-phosphate kinase
MRVTVLAPNRIDLAGGTTDLYPLYLLMDGGCTVNASITVSSRVDIKPLGGKGVRIVSEDLGHTLEADEPSELPLNGPLGLVARAIRTFPPPEGVEVTTRNEAPAGSGLGASSALAVALLKGLFELRNSVEAPEKLINLAVNIETANLGVPAGKQDHIGALYGGVSIIDFSHDDFQRTGLDPTSGIMEELEQRIVLSYTGEGRFSGMNNWEITKAFIDRSGDIREILIQIRDVARAMGAALRAGDLEALPELLGQEWDLRRRLSPGVSSSRIDALMAAAKQAGAHASKICGAGGGGCMITMVPPGYRAQVGTAIEAGGGRVMPFHIAREGLRITASES